MKDVIESRIDLLQKEFKKFRKVKILPIKESMLPDNFYPKYSSIFNRPRFKHNINYFAKIGLTDPFQGEYDPYTPSYVYKAKIILDLVYPAQRFDKEYSPQCLYVPNR